MKKSHGVLLAFALIGGALGAEEPQWSWRTDVETVKAEAASHEDGLIVVVNMFYKTCAYCRAFYSIAHDPAFLEWAKSHHVYLVTADATLHADTDLAERYFWKLYRQNPVSPTGGLPPLLAVARAASPDKLVGYGSARSQQRICGVAYGGTVNSLVSCLSAALGSQSEPSPTEPDTGFNSAMEVVGALFSDGEIAGTVLVKIGRRNARKGCKVSGSVTFLGGKKVNLRFDDAYVQPQGKVVTVGFSVLQAGSAVRGQFSVSADGLFEAGATLGAYDLVSANIGGDLQSNSPQFRLLTPFGSDEVPGIISEFVNEGVTYAMQPTDGVLVGVQRQKWKLASAANVKYKKNRESGISELVVDMSRGRTNVNGLKLTYAAKTGMFKGSFQVFSNGGTETKPKLKKTKVSVSGIVIDGRGHGVTSLRNTLPHGVIVE